MVSIEIVKDNSPDSPNAKDGLTNNLNELSIKYNSETKNNELQNNELQNNGLNIEKLEKININNLNVPTLCLTMIVKNESKIITRLFDSVISIIDCFCICDTGSTDNTVDVIKTYFESKNIPGKIVFEPFKNFAHNRNFAVKSSLGMSNYILLLDADMILEINNFNKKMLKHHTYYILQGNDNFYYNNVRIISNNGLYNYVGVTHEYINIPPNTGINALDKTQLFIRDIGDGGSKGDKYSRDIALLLKGIDDEPANRERYYFYLANTYFDSGENKKAKDAYRKRIEYKGYDHEVWYSYYRLGQIYKRTNKIAKAIHAWMDGYECLPIRIENIYEIICYYRTKGQTKLGYQYYKLAKDIRDKITNKDTYLFLHNDIYTYKLDYEYSIIAGYNGISNINNEVINIFNNCNDDNIITNTLSNMKFYKDNLKPLNVIDLTNTIQHTINNRIIKLTSSSNCLLPTNDGYLCNIRYVNYRIDKDGSYHDINGHVITVNMFTEFTKDFKIKNNKLLDVSFDGRLYIGIEDVRLHKYKNDELHFIGTGFHKNNKIGMVTGIYNIDGCLQYEEVNQTFFTTDCEKNWVFVDYKNEDCVIYKWNPLYICKIVTQSESGPSQDNNSGNKKVLDIVKINGNMPPIFKHVRGSSCGFKYNNEIWFMLHLVSYEKPRHYYHIIAIFDNEMNILRYSAPFKFDGEAIEYSLSIVVEDTRVLISYSNWDKTSKIGIYDKHYIDSIVKYKHN